ncbi:Membrane protein involved in the export of O-antigen and teichoic acid [Jannaschia faecimaris]|uniref:Membrane protein involved in the export of O-antigen and teichoic acid n=1 Tax=Jannaschia faecimaris TaxID=1244108 RepID=A0A1H3J186_9RHOB|nr:oligosaccharide flippase family protein [Jannaschia faecimaris]SDY33299.1 Membrane protein involved in the export of O-antigen and teichoic acid [Jannaschia faecimaris]
MLRAALLLLSGNVATSGLLFARNLAVAALIPVEDYGIAATFALAMAAVEMASSFGLQQQIVQARDGDDPRLQDALTGFQLLRGVIAAAVLFALAGPLATFLDIPEVTWAYRLLALVPLLNATQHFDIHRLNRDNRFGPLIATNTLPSAVALALIWPLAAWLGDWRVMLAAILIHAVLTAVLSHAVAERPWRPVMDRVLWGRTIRFGWPILLNALVLFLVFQADKLAVGRILGLVPLGVFAMGVTLTLTPSLIAARTIQTATLPRLSVAVGAHGFDRKANGTLVASMSAGLAVAVAGVVGGWLSAPFLRGTDWAGLTALLGPLAIVQGLRIAKSGSAIVGLALGRSGNAVMSNLPRVVALIAGVAALAQGTDLLVLIWLGAVGEAAGFVLSAALVTWRDGVRWRMDQSIVFATGVVLTILSLSWSPLLFGAGLALPLLALMHRKAA